MPGSAFRRERDLGDFLVGNLEHIGVLIIGREVRTPFCGRIDLLGIDAEGNLVVIELKRGATRPEVVAQVLEYLYWAKDLTRDQLIEIASSKLLRLDLPTAYAEHYGHALPEVANRKQRLVIVASDFDATTYHGIKALENGGFDVHALHYRLDSGRVEIAPYRASAEDGSSAQARSTVMLRPAEQKRLTGALESQEDVQDFWDIHYPQLIGPFVPFGLMFALYVEWCRTEAEQGRHREGHQMGHFGRLLAAVVNASSVWSHEVMRPGGLMGDEPLLHKVPDWVHPDPKTLMSGYLRLQPSRSHDR
jgi:hypothetical protein